MRKASGLILFVVLLTAGIYLLMPPRSEATFIYYSSHAFNADTSPPQPAPSSIFYQHDKQRLSLEYIVKHKHYTISSPLTDLKSYTRVSLLLEHLDNIPVLEPTNITAALMDDLGQSYQLSSPIEVDSVTSHVHRYLLSFPLLNPQAKNVVISVTINDIVFELNGAAIP